ncbi:glycosyltransferase [Mucilaginibacter sp. BJC16-A38]|uniref:glycosyltransferase n=1 Tax=Mucilaginibacter phenanthrenivorans TaxID=1234842 RepID=UPI00215838F3|nr:glycosyltransferase [Mucilaginibacter phenanthrenivorans]MCR8557342.1 glycosyltransferase [Mucilaginibacter phenanthrenivorans]
MTQTTEKQLQGKKILFATVAADGHFNPLTGLAKFLMDAGCDVRWYTSGIYKDKLAQLGIQNYPFIKSRDITGSSLHELFPERVTIADAGEKANFDMINVFIKPGPGKFEDILDIRKTFPFDAVIADNMFPAIPYISAKIDVPVISIGIIPLPESSDDLGPYGPGFYPPTNDVERLKMAELRMAFKNVVYKAGTDCLTALLEQYGVPYNGVDIFDILTKAPDLYLQVGSPSLEYKRSSLGKNVRFIGALLPYTESRVQAQWSDERLKRYQKVVLVTQGTIEGDVSKLLEPTLDAFKGTDTLVIAATGGFHTTELKNKYDFDNLIIEDYIPFDQIMPLADVFVTNGGYGGTLLAVEHQLPLVTAGLYEGKAEICARIGFFKYGIDLKTERPASADILAAVKVIMDDPQYKDNITLLSREMEGFDAKALCAGYLSELLISSPAS